MNASLDSCLLPTPAGPFCMLADRDGVLRAAGFADAPDALLAMLGPGTAARARADLGAASRAVRAYLDGELRAVDDLPTHQDGAPFAAAARRAMRAIPPGQTRSYRELAAEAGRPAAVRAAGSACARNRIALVVPCHRVLRGDGSLGGFLWGLAVKRWLLEHERAHAVAGER